MIPNDNKSKENVRHVLKTMGTTMEYCSKLCLMQKVVTIDIGPSYR